MVSSQFCTCSNNLPLAGMFLKNWIRSNFNNAFHKQKEGSRTVPSQNNVVLKIEFLLISTGRNVIFEKFDSS